MSTTDFENEGEDISRADHESLAEQSLSRIEANAAALTSDVAAQDILMWLDRSAWLLERVRTFRRFVEQAAIAWIDANGDLQLGPLRFTVGVQSITRCLDVRATIHALLSACGGDVDAVAQYLAANPYKYGSCRSIRSPEVYRRLFLTERRPKLINGTPQKQLIRSDDRFVRGGNAEPDQSGEK
jgi:hypothetical protein